MRLSAAFANHVLQKLACKYLIHWIQSIWRVKMQWSGYRTHEYQKGWVGWECGTRSPVNRLQSNNSIFDCLHAWWSFSTLHTSKIMKFAMPYGNFIFCPHSIKAYSMSQTATLFVNVSVKKIARHGTNKNVSWLHFSWPTRYVPFLQKYCFVSYASDPQQRTSPVVVDSSHGCPRITDIARISWDTVIDNSNNE